MTCKTLINYASLKNSKEMMMLIMMMIVYMNVYKKRYIGGLPTTIRSSKSASCKQPIKEHVRLSKKVSVRVRIRSLHKKSYMSWLTV